MRHDIFPKTFELLEKIPMLVVNYLALVEVINLVLLSSQEDDWIGECLPLEEPQKKGDYYQVLCTWGRVILLTEEDYKDYLELAR